LRKYKRKNPYGGGEHEEDNEGDDEGNNGGKEDEDDNIQIWMYNEKMKEVKYHIIIVKYHVYYH